MKTRVLRVTFEIPGQLIVLDQSLRLSVRIHKMALAIQNKATIEVTGLDTQARESLLSQFTAWNKRKTDIGQLVANHVPVTIEAGYSENGIENSAVVYKGEVVLVEPGSAPPDIGVRITAYTNQINQTTFISQPAPVNPTLIEYVQWANRQMGLTTQPVCDTSYNNTTTKNPSASTYVAGALVIDIQNNYRVNIVAYIDDGVLIVKDANKAINTQLTSNITTFIGIPMWNEWGAEFTTMFDPSVKVGQSVFLDSVMNPSLKGNYVLTELEYDLTSRDKPFYVKGTGSPPA